MTNQWTLVTRSLPVPSATPNVRGFHRDEHGGVIPFVVILFLLMVVASGMAVDFMRHEMARADLQNSLDRGVLAAANLAEISDASEEESAAAAKEIIEDYMKSRTYKVPILSVDVSAPRITGGKRISASAQYELDTFFLRIMGLDKLTVPVSSQAEAGAGNVEIVLVLDVSNSMTTASSWRDGETRLTDLQKAAKEFVSEVLFEDPTDPAREPRDNTAISIVPYSAQVNLSDSLAAELSINRHHDYGNCVNFDATDYNSTAIGPTTSLDQTQHFYDSEYTQWYPVRVFEGWGRYWNGWGYRYYPIYSYEWRSHQIPATLICPRAANQILPYSNNEAKLHEAIDALEPEGWTSAYLGMKWGAALLDPAIKPAINSLVGNGEIDSGFTNWPANWTDNQTTKHIVLMTDGRNTIQYKVDDTYYADQGVDWFNENVVPEEYKGTIVDNDNDGLGDTYLQNICNQIKAQATNTIIYTIGFELDETTDDGAHAAEVLGRCASSDATQFKVEAVDIDLAFDHIAQQITNLKLTH